MKRKIFAIIGAVLMLFVLTFTSGCGGGGTSSGGSGSSGSSSSSSSSTSGGISGSAN